MKLQFATLLLIAITELQAGVFYGLGTGLGYSNLAEASGEGGSSSLTIGLFGNVEYSPGFRDRYIFTSQVEWAHQTAYNNYGNIAFFTAGLKYTPIFYFEVPNVGDSVQETVPYCGKLFLPLFYLMDFYIWFTQVALPSHPFYSVSAVLARSPAGTGVGLEASLGVTTGWIDVKIPLRFVYLDGLVRRRVPYYSLGMQVSYHFDFGEGSFVRKRPLVPKNYKVPE